MASLMRDVGDALARRWALATMILLGCLGLGAVWAASQSPVYEASATVAGAPEELLQLDVPLVLSQLESIVAGPSATELEPSLRPEITMANSTIRFDVRAPDPSVAQQISQGYADTYLQIYEAQIDDSTGLVISETAEFPLSPVSPNLGRVALLSGLIGLMLAALAAWAVERVSAGIDSVHPPANPEAQAVVVQRADLAPSTSGTSESTAASLTAKTTPNDIAADLAPSWSSEPTERSNAPTDADTPSPLPRISTDTLDRQRDPKL